MDTNELIGRAEQELVDGDPSAGKTVDRARRALFKQRDAAGLERLLELAGRFDQPAAVIDAIRQDCAFVERHAQHSSRASKSGRGDVAAVLGGVAGAVIGVVLTFPILSGTQPDGLVYLAAWMFFGFVGALLGAVLAYGLWRVYRAAKTVG